jgi:hypothetical protein
MSESAFADWTQMGQLRVPPKTLEVSNADARSLPGDLEAGPTFELVALEWSWGFGTASSIAVGFSDVGGTRYYLVSDAMGHHVVAASSTPSEGADRELLDLFFDTTWSDSGLAVTNAPSDISWAEPFKFEDIVEWLTRSYQRHPDLWESTLDEILEYTDEDDADAALPPKPEPPALEGEAEIRRKLEDEEPDPGYSLHRVWALSKRSARIAEAIEAWRREQDPTYAAAWEQWARDVTRIEQEQAEMHERGLIRRYLTEHLGLSG